MAELIDQLAGYVPEPYQHDRVMLAARQLGHPFLLREIVDATELPAHVAHRVLSRAVKANLLARQKALITYPHFAGRSKWIPGGRKRRVYLYTFAEPK